MVKPLTLEIAVLVLFLCCGHLYGMTSNVECDSLFMNDQSVLAVRNLTWNDSLISYSNCHDTSQVVHSVPWKQVLRVKTSSGTMILPPMGSKIKSSVPREEKLEKQVARLRKLPYTLIAALVLIKFALIAIPILALFILWRAYSLRKAIRGHRNEAQLRRSLKKTIKTTLWILGAEAAAFLLLLILFGVFLAL